MFTCGVDVAELPYFDAEMLALENQITEPKHHRRVYEELSAKWIAAISACTDLPTQADSNMIKALLLSVWGGRRYRLLVGMPDMTAEEWLTEMEHLCHAALLRPISGAHKPEFGKHQRGQSK